MDKSSRNLIQKATQNARRLLEAEFSQQLEGLFDILPDGTIAPEPGKHLDATQCIIRQKIVAAIEHEKASGSSDSDAVAAYFRETSFTYLNRFVALKMLEARGLAQECVSKGEQSSGFKEFSGLAPGLAELPDRGYRLYIESLFDELSIEIRILFDRQNPASLLWPRRKVLDELLSTLNREEIGGIWGEDETIGWVYQYFNSGEERKKMRDESAAPRNSRELAVRNQFFTPRYVVEFLTDNTLGRIWYEMRKGDTVLKDECRYLVRRPNEIFLAPGENPPVDQENETDLSQEELLNKTVHIEHRPKKDPRDLRVLDPACGSGHFLLYAFDLLERIYEEAWEDHERPGSEATGHTLRKDFETVDDLRRAVPKLIIEYNLHGIDIDSRAVQIAAMALWMRAQKTWKNFGIKAAERPQVTKSNIVTAEPMPGEEDMKEEFTAGLKPRVLGQLVDVVFDKMKLAGEAGSLLKIEEEIKTAVAEARNQWLEDPKPEQQLLFPDMTDPRPKQQELSFDFKGVTDEGFWEQAEDCILDSLKDYAERAENSHALRCRLFAEDTARGFALIDLCRGRYDVVLMNPPFGEPASGAREYQENSYKRTKNDIYAASIDRAINILNQRGGLGAITSRTCFFLKRFQSWREKIMLKEVAPFAVVDLGHGVLDSAAVETACYAAFKDNSGPALFIKADETENKIPFIKSAIQELRNSEESKSSSYYYLQPSSFCHLPESKWLYWLPTSIRNAFVTLKTYKESGFLACAGLQTNDDFRFVRTSWEVPRDQIGLNWANFYKGGEYSPYFDDIHLCVNWRDNGYEIKQHTISLGNSPSRHVVNEEHYFSPGYAYINISSVGFSPQLFPSGVVFSIQGQFIGGKKSLPSMALMGSSTVAVFLDIINPGRHYQAGQVQLLPIPQAPIEENVEHKAFELINLKRNQCDYVEDTRLFNAPIRIDQDVLLKEVGANIWAKLTSQLGRVLELQDDIDVAAYSAYRLDEESIRYISHEVSESRNHTGFLVLSSLSDHLKSSNSLTIWIASSILSYSIGNVFGRWDVRIALNSSLAPKWAGSFEPLPVCPPGMLVGPDGLPSESGRIVSEEWLCTRLDANSLPPEGLVMNPTIPDSDYPLKITWGGILVDDPGFEGRLLHDQDIVFRTREVLDVLWKHNAQEIEREICEILNVTNLRTYFRKSFFKDNIKRYSKSRRKAPIYWQLSTPSASYSIWLYYHRFTKDTFYKVLNEYIIPKLQFEERELTNVRQQYGASPTAGQRKEIAAREAFVTELSTFQDEVARIAPLWNPNLNDGVIINFAPLWRLVPQNKPWQKECTNFWNKLVKGDYDWAHLAMHLWPERVVKKCAKDRSLAIAHGLNETFWEEDDKGKWKHKEVSKEAMDSLIQERISPTVKAALEDLLKAPIPANMAGKKRKKKA